MANTYTGSDVGKAGLNVAEEDGSPSVFGVTKINVSDGTLTDNGGGEVTITTGGGGGGTPGGSDGQVQYNNGGSFGGASALAYDDTNNRVGINTTSPEAKLEVVATTTSEYGMVVDHANGQFAVTQYGGIHLDNAESTPNLWQISERDGESLDIAFGTPDSGKNVGASSTALRITSDGEVGIGLGSTDPASILHIAEGASGTPRLLLDHDGDQSATANLSFLDSTGGGNAQQLGVIDFRGQNSASEEIQYARIRSDSQTYTDAGEYGRIVFDVQRNGVITEVMRWGGLEVSINEGGGDINFKVEGNNDDPLFFCDAGNDRVGIGISTPACELDVRAGNDSGFVDFRVSRDDNQYTGFRNSDASGGYLINHSRESNKKPLYIDSVHNSAGSAAGDNNILFRTGALSSPTERMRILSSNGNVGIGVTAPAQALHVSGTIRQTASTSSVLVSNANGDIVSATNLQDVSYYQAAAPLLPATGAPPVIGNWYLPTAATFQGWIQIGAAFVPAWA
jgi:hypothetical protein